MTNNISDIPLLVISCDRYKDLWSPFFAIFKKRWPDCPFPLYLGSNHNICTVPGVSSIAIGEDNSWADGVRRMLDQLNSDHVIIFLEDFFILESVDTKRVIDLVDTAVSERVGCLRLIAGLPLALPPTEPLPERPDIGVIQKGAPYRVSAQVAVWQVETLRKLLIPGMSAWEFEEIGTAISEEIDDLFWGVYEAAIKYAQCVEKGRWKPEGLELCRNEGVNVDLSARSAFTPEELDQHYRTGSITYCIRRNPFDLRLWWILFMRSVSPSTSKYILKCRLRYKLNRIKRRNGNKGLMQ